MAATRFTFTFSLLMTTVICLMTIKAEKQPTAAEADYTQTKQMYLMPQYYPANTQFYYPENRRYDSLDDGFAYSYQILASGDDSTSDGRHIQSEGRDDLTVMLSNRNPLRQATINILPAEAECLNANIKDDGLGPCKAASQTERGFINMKFSAADQLAVVAITADSQRHTRVTLICNEITAGVFVFTQTGKITAPTDTPRTEVGYIQLVVTSAAADDVVKCFWNSHHHYQGMYN